MGVAGRSGHGAGGGGLVSDVVSPPVDHTRCTRAPSGALAVE